LTEILKINPARFPLRALQPAVKTLLDGGVVAAATESYYALLAIADRGPALEALFSLKFGGDPGYTFAGQTAQPSENPFLLLVDSRERAKAYAKEVPKEAELLMDRYWPGLLTIVFKAQAGLHPAILGKRRASIALRVDSSPVPGALCRMTDRGVTGTSANPHGRPPACTAREALRYFGGRLDMVVDTGSTMPRRKGRDAPLKKPSTIIDVTRRPFSVVRDGAISGREVLKALGASAKG
jgi:L-threonylcarbamoyladenylate synthase